MLGVENQGLRAVGMRFRSVELRFGLKAQGLCPGFLRDVANARA